jgi:phospholipase/carboxylesterase
MNASSDRSTDLDLAALEITLRGGTDGKGSGGGPLVVLLHGYGAPGSDLVGLHRAFPFPDTTRYAFPAGRIDLSRMFGMPARAWWHIDLEARIAKATRGEARDFDEVPEGMDASASMVANVIDQLRGSAPLVLGGFSQGGMLALEVALRLASPPQALALWSSTLLARARQQPDLAKLRETAIVQSHGEADAILPYKDARELETHLRQAGLLPTFVPFRGGHEIPLVVVQKTSEIALDALSKAAQL